MSDRGAEMVATDAMVVVGGVMALVWFQAATCMNRAATPGFRRQLDEADTPDGRPSIGRLC